MNVDWLIEAITRPKWSTQIRSSRTARILGAAILVLALSWTCMGATIGDFVWMDSNMNGIQDHAEIGIDNVTVALYNQYRLLVAVTQTVNGGRYRFENITPGQYYLRFFTFPFTYVNRGYDDELDSDVYPETCRTALFELSNNSDLSWDAGIIFYFPGVVQPADPLFSTPPSLDNPPTDTNPIIFPHTADIAVTKRPSRFSVTEPGGLVMFTVEIKNTGSTLMTVVSLTDSIYGDLDGQGSINLPILIFPGMTFTGCFEGFVAGSAGNVHFNSVTATARDPLFQTVQDVASAGVLVTRKARLPGEHEQHTDVHFTYMLVFPDGTCLYGAVTIPSGHFEYGIPYAMPVPSTPGATIEGRPALPGEAAVTFSPPASGDSSNAQSEVSTVIGSTAARVQVSCVQWTYDEETVEDPVVGGAEDPIVGGPGYGGEPVYWGEQQDPNTVHQQHEKHTDVHFTYTLVLPDGTRLLGAVTIPSGHFEYGTPYAMPIPSAPRAIIEGREALPGEASVTFSPPATGNSSNTPSEVSSVVGSSDARVQITGIQWTYDGRPVGNPITADPYFWGEPQVSKDLCEAFAARIETDKSSYSVGEGLIITFYVSEKAEVTLYDHLPNGTTQTMPLGTVSAGTHRLPGPGQSLTITEPAGVETLELQVTSESGCTALVRTSFTVVPSESGRPSWVEPCARQLAQASGVEYKAEGTNGFIHELEHVSFMIQELQIFEGSVAPSVTTQMKQCASALLNYVQQVSGIELSDIVLIFMTSYYETRM